MNEDIEAFKIITLGDSGVGKSSIIMRYANGIFDENYLPTVGIESYIKEVWEN